MKEITPHLSHPKYRPDIDGLRAIAVILVLFFHAKIFGVNSGFVGVDVFFVISGYLITLGIKNGLEKGDFSFIDFFKRRLWRLQPVFITLIIVVTIITTLTYLPDDYLKYTNSLRYASSFLSNDYFSNLNNGYFTDDVNIMPLLHTWSLSVEWQWYLLLPFLMFIFFKLLNIKKWTYWILPLTALMIIGIHFGSLAIQINEIDESKTLSFIFNDKNSLKYYYSFSGRIFEMLIGSSLAVIGSLKVDRIPQWLNSIIGIACIAIIVAIGMRGGVLDFYPNKYALSVCLSSAILIYLGGSKNKGFATKILSIRPIVFVGLISYSLYIWHWPVLAFIRNLSIEETWSVISLALLLSFLLAFISYRYVETYFRRKNSLSFGQTLIILVLTPYLLVSLLDHQNRNNHGTPERLGSSYMNLVHNKTMQYNWLDRIKKECNVENLSLIMLNCHFNVNAKKTALVMGDSYSDHSWQFVKSIIGDNDISLESSSLGGCLAVENNYSNDNENVCRNRTTSNYKKIEEGLYQYVIISETWARYISKENYPNTDEAKKNLEAGLEKSIKKIVNSKAKPIIIIGIFDAYKNQNPFYLAKIQQNSCVMKKYKSRGLLESTCDFDSNYKNDEYRIWIDNMFLRLKAKFPELILINMYELQCSTGVCRTDIDGYPVYRDWSHLTDYSSHQFGIEYLKMHGNIFK
ncbi:acyltransferase family protein [Yersinia sp. 1652 StPb PI]|uniref:acyltransferase family protein n=1 Tax=Yersinia sp. 1652 StPb PI TaxID=3061649 RepID=UPI00355C0839